MPTVDAPEPDNNDVIPPLDPNAAWTRTAPPVALAFNESPSNKSIEPSASVRLGPPRTNKPPEYNWLKLFWITTSPVEPHKAWPELWFTLRPMKELEPVVRVACVPTAPLKLEVPPCWFTSPASSPPITFTSPPDALEEPVPHDSRKSLPSTLPNPSATSTTPPNMPDELPFIWTELPEPPPELGRVNSRTTPPESEIPLPNVICTTPQWPGQWPPEFAATISDPPMEANSRAMPDSIPIFDSS